MTPERWQQLKALLAVALEVEPANRTAHLDEACAHDPSLRPELERLLAAEENAGSEFLAGPAIASDQTDRPAAAQALWIGRRVGQYEIVEEIGVGGMGEVYRAVRADDQYRSEVAIKLVRSGSGFVVNRFKTERQILAGLDHPNIARLLDGGTTEHGAPYFVMELVEGRPIDEYCHAHSLSTRDRLKLFVQICSAVQYAHQRLIIHRDLKPTNILVTAGGVPKLLDFGLAKMLEPRGVAAQSDQTMLGIRFLTPGYASPEQINEEPMTTSSDVYSLGVVLYELLTGLGPYRVATNLPHDMARAICQSHPEPPSMVVRRLSGSTVTGSARLSDRASKQLAKRLAGDLDNITLMALRKEPSRRYASVEQFAEDIRRHLASLPVVARNDTLAYRSSKFIARHKGAVSAAFAIAATLIAGLATTLHESRVAQQQAALAQARFNDQRRLANSLIFEIHDSIRQLPGATSARQLLAKRAQEHLSGLAAASQSDPSLLGELAAAYSRLADVLGNPLDVNVGNTSGAVQSYRTSSGLWEKALALEPSNPQLRRELAESYLALALALGRSGDQQGDHGYVQRAVRLLEPLASSRPDDVAVQYALAKAYERTAGDFVDSNDMERGRTLYETSLAMYERLARLAPNDPRFESEISFGHKHIAAILAVQHRLQDALAHDRTALAIEEARLAKDSGSVKSRYAVTFTYSDTGYILGELGDLDAALAYYRKALGIRSALAKADPQDTRTRQGLANTYGYIGDLLRRKTAFQPALDAYKQALGILDALFLGDSANDNLAFQRARSQAALGWLHEEMAFRPRVQPDQRRALCGEARQWLSKALPVILERKRRGRLVANDIQMAEEIQRAFEHCRLPLGEMATRRPVDRR